MSILKAELKQMVTHEIGVRVEDALEAAKRELSLLEGRQAAFLDGAKAVEALLKAVDEDVTAEKYPLETAEVAKRFLVRGVQALSNLSQQATNLRLAQAGKVAAFDHTIKLLSNLIEIEKKKVAQLQQQGPQLVPPPAPEGDAVGGEEGEPHGHRSIKEQRRAEDAAQQKAAAESAASAAPPAEEPVAEAEAEASEPVEEEPSKKRRKGKRRAANA